jgi:eukaryotic-like serine/threonine-protein kinase
MGEVYRASDERLGREVAIKVLRPVMASDPDRLHRFEQEARAAAVLNHPNIVAIYDIGVHGGAPYIVSELLQGRTLREQLLEGPLSVRQCKDFAVQIAQGLAAAHEQHIVHRDLKPENLFLTRDNRVKILDFGIAKLTSPDADSYGERPLVNLTTQTKAGSVLGTAGYMSPEQLRGKLVDPRSDIFSFGAILYEMLTGVRAFRGETDVDTMMAVLKDDPPEMQRTRESIPPAFEQIVRHCLEKEPEERFPSARELAFALSTVSSTTGRNLMPLRTRPGQVRKIAIWSAAILLVAGLGLLLGERLRQVPAPEYRRMTFERGTVYSARFSPDGRTVVYSAAWNGLPAEVYSTVENSPLARPLGLTSAYLFALSRSNELALALHGNPVHREISNATLARSPLVGGTPHEVLEDVRAADFGPQGDLAVAHRSDVSTSRDRLEYPIGKVLFQSTGWISDIRFSPAGEKIAFMNHPAAWDDRGSLCMVDLAGHLITLSGDWESEAGLAWSPRGDEIWFTAAERSVSNRALWAVTTSGKRRRILSVPSGFTLQDIAADGRVLITVENDRLAMEWTGTNNKETQDLSWYDWSIAKDFTPDGQWVLFEEASEPAGPNYAVAIRKIDGSPPIRLGDGSVGGLSPDGKWALSIFTRNPQHITLYPVGVGQAREISVPELAHLENGSAHFLPDGQHAIINGNQAGHSVRAYLVDLAAGKLLRPVTPEGVLGGSVSLDGKYLVANGPNRRLTLYPLNGGDPVPLSVPSPPYNFCQWLADGKSILIVQSGEIPVKVYRSEVPNGKMTLVRELTPADRAGVVSIAPVIARHDGSAFAFSYDQTLSVLYVISGLK